LARSVICPIKALSIFLLHDWGNHDNDNYLHEGGNQMIAEKTNEYMVQVLEIAQEDLNQILERLKEFDQLNRERERLETLINFAKNYLGKTAQAEMPNGEIEAPEGGLGLEIPLIEKPIAQGAMEIIREAGHPLTLKEIQDGFRKRHWKLSEKNGREVLRFTLRKKPEIFIKSMKKGKGPSGLYDLRINV
jgi:hypothetical protein